MPSMFPPSLDLIDETGEKSDLRESRQNDSVSDLHLQSNELNGSVNVVDKSEEVSFIPLERCMRIVPHDQNCGAFFIAVLHKVANLPGRLKFLAPDYFFSPLFTIYILK